MMKPWQTKCLESAKMTLLSWTPNSTLNSKPVSDKFFNPVSLSFFICKMKLEFLLQAYFEDFDWYPTRSAQLILVFPPPYWTQFRWNTSKGHQGHLSTPHLLSGEEGHRQSVQDALSGTSSIFLFSSPLSLVDQIKWISYLVNASKVHKIEWKKNPS